MSVDHLDWVPIKQTPYSYNASFTWNGLSYDVNATLFSYSWKVADSGSSQARQCFIFYPKRVEQSPVSVELIMRDPDDYRQFGDFVRQYHLGVTSDSSAPSMVFTMPSYDIKYSVIIESLNMSFNNSMTAPRATFQMTVIDNGVNIGRTGSGSGTTGGAADVVTNKVDVGSIKASGDSAFQSK